MQRFRIWVEYGTVRGEPLSPFTAVMSQTAAESFLAELFGDDGALADGMVAVTHVEVIRIRDDVVTPSEDQQQLLR